MWAGGRRDDSDHRIDRRTGHGFGPPGADRQLSADGIELRFAVNYLAGYRLTRLLLPLLISSAPSRIVNVASAGQLPIDFADPMLEREYDGISAYRRSKLAQIMFTFDLADELRDNGVTVTSLHPATFMNTTMVRETGTDPASSVARRGQTSRRTTPTPGSDSRPCRRICSPKLFASWVL